MRTRLALRELKASILVDWRRLKERFRQAICDRRHWEALTRKRIKENGGEKPGYTWCARCDSFRYVPWEDIRRLHRNGKARKL